MPPGRAESETYIIHQSYFFSNLDSLIAFSLELLWCRIWFRGPSLSPWWAVRDGQERCSGETTICFGYTVGVVDLLVLRVVRRQIDMA